MSVSVTGCSLCTSFQSLPESLSSLKSLAQQALGNNNNSLAASPGPYLDQLGALAGADRIKMSGSQGSGQGQALKNEANIPPLLGVAPLGIVPLNKEHQFQYRSENFLRRSLLPL